MLQRVHHAVVIDTRRNVVGVLLHRVERVAHGHARSGGAQHGHIVAAVAKGHRLAYVYAHVRGNGAYAVGLVGSGRRDIAEGRIPARRRTARQMGQYDTLLIFGEERSYLQHALVDYLVDRHVELGVRHLQHVVEHVVDRRVAVYNLYVILAHHDGGQTAAVAEVDHGAGLVLRNEVFAHHAVAHDAQCARGQDVAVHKIFCPGYVVEQLARTARGGEYPDAARLGLAQRVQRRLGYGMSIEADERAVNIKEYRFCFHAAKLRRKAHTV